MSDPFILDRDPIIPTGEAATAEDVAAMIADPESPVTVDVLPLIDPDQVPTPAMIADAFDAQGEGP